MDFEGQLIEKSKSGSIEAFEQLIVQYEKKAYNIAFRIMGNEEDAKDMTQEAFIRIFKSIGSFKEQSSFSTWMYRIVTNICLDELRRRKNERLTYGGSIEETIDSNTEDSRILGSPSKDTPESAYEKLEKKQAIMKAINELNTDYKSVIVLRDIQGFSYDEISKMLDCSSGTVKSRINRARNILKDKLKGMLELSVKNTV